MAARLRLIYIASPGHSGSTLLDLLLNAHSKIVSGGELKRFQPFIGDLKRRCTCGITPILACPFWAAVAAELEARRLAPATIRTDGADQGAVDENVVLLQAIAKVGGADILVDSSKTLRRLKLLMESPDIDVLPVILIRDPRGQIWSRIRKGHHFGTALREYRSIYRDLAKSLKDRPQLWVRYEDLATDPKRTLARILALVGEQFEPGQLDWAQSGKHNINGNRMRFSTDSAIVRDESWRGNLTLRQRIAIRLRARRVWAARPAAG